MNWGLFLALALFFLPLSLIVRTVFELATADRPIAHPGQRLRIALVLFLAVPTIGKMPTMLYATIGGWDEIGTLTQAFMVTPWGNLQAATMLGAVVVYDLFSPGIFAALDPERLRPTIARRRYLLRDGGIILVCFGCALAATAFRL